MHDLRERITSDGSLTVIDVRERSEWQDGHIDCCENVPFYKLRAASEIWTAIAAMP